MHLKIRNELVLVDALSVILSLLITLNGPHFLRVALGLAFVLFLPGYCLIAALFPKRSDLDSIERVALSFGLSIAVVPLIGLGLNYTPWGIRLYPILISVTGFILATSGIAMYRRRILPDEERFAVEVKADLPRWRQLPAVDRVLSVALAASILFAIGTLVYVVSVPKVGERFTEFYVLGLSGKAEGYPRELRVGETGRVILGIVNREYAEVDYRVDIRIGGVVTENLGPITLKHEEKLEREVGFTPRAVGDDVKVEFLLYFLGQRRQEGVPYKKKENVEEPYRTLHLWVDVKPAAT